MQRKTVVLGASPNPARYSYIATLRLLEAGEMVYPVGIRPGKIGDLSILLDTPYIEDVHTITMYVGPDRQPELYDYILGLQPQRIYLIQALKMLSSTN